MSMRGAWAWISVSLVLTATILSRVRLAGMGWGDVFSLGQLLVEVTLLPAAIVGFTIAAKEFREAQAKADVDLFWWMGSCPGVKEMILKIPKEGSAQQRVSPMLMNTGNAVGLWYCIRIWMPRTLFSLDPPSGTPESPDGWTPVAASTSDHWKLGPDKGEDSAEQMLFTFMSNGDIAAFPDDGLVLFQLPVLTPAHRQWPTEFRIRYSIVTGWGQRRDGHLTLYPKTK